MNWDMLPELALKSVVTLGITLALLHLIRHRSAAQRAWVAHIGLFATLALPLAVTLLPRWEVAAAPVAQLAAPVQAIFSAPVMEQALPKAAVPSLAEMPVPVSAESSSPLTAMVMALMPDTGTLVALAWGLPALMLLLVMLVAVMRLFALQGRATVMVEHSWLGALAQAQLRMNFKHGTALLVSRELISPVSWGVLRPVILLNEAAVNNRSDAEAIIAHELAHVSRLDWAGLLLGRIVTALFWFNPMAWMVARQAHQLREEAADDAVLRSNVDRMDYAALLVGAARHETRGFLLAANGVAPSRGSLKRRITRVLDEHQLRAPAYLGWMSACVLGAVLVALPLAAFSATHPQVEIAQAVTVTPAVPVEVQAAPLMPVMPPVKPVQAHAPLSAQDAAQLRAEALELAREIREREREKAEGIARHEREKLFDLARRAQEMAERELERQVRARDRAENVRAQVESSVNIDARRETVTIDVPGVFIQATPDGATVRAPGVNIRANPQGATIRAPGVNIQANADGAESESRAGQRSGNMAGSQAGTDAGRLAGAGAGKPSANELIKMAVLDISPRYRDEIAAAGYYFDVDQLHQIRIHGMTGDWLRGLAGAGYDRLTVSQIRNIAIHRVTPDFAVRMVQQAASRPTPEQLVQMRIAYGGRMPGEPNDKDKDKDKDKSK